MKSKEILPESEREFIRKAYCDHGASEGTTVARIFKALEVAEERIEELEKDIKQMNEDPNSYSANNPNGL